MPQPSTVPQPAARSRRSFLGGVGVTAGGLGGGGTSGHYDVYTADAAGDPVAG